jgi:hypothetical protein
LAVLFLECSLPFWSAFLLPLRFLRKWDGSACSRGHWLRKSNSPAHVLYMGGRGEGPLTLVQSLSCLLCSLCSPLSRLLPPCTLLWVSWLPSCFALCFMLVAAFTSHNALLYACYCLHLPQLLAVASSSSHPCRATLYGPYRHLFGVRASGWSARHEE